MTTRANISETISALTEEAMIVGLTVSDLIRRVVETMEAFESELDIDIRRDDEMFSLVSRAAGMDDLLRAIEGIESLVREVL